MSTPRKDEANRRNASKSTGPRTQTGKDISRRNALQHGMTARTLLLVPGEDAGALAELAAGVRAALAPVGAVETLLAERIVSLAWRLRRSEAVDAGLYARTAFTRAEGCAASDAVSAGRTIDPLDHLLRENAPRWVVTDPARHQDACRRRADAEAALNEGNAGLAATWVADSGGGASLFERLARYEGTLSRELLRTLHELERMQARRAGVSDSAPVAAAGGASGDDGT